MAQNLEKVIGVYTDLLDPIQTGKFNGHVSLKSITVGGSLNGCKYYEETKLGIPYAVVEIGISGFLSFEDLDISMFSTFTVRTWQGYWYEDFDKKREDPLSESPMTVLGIYAVVGVEEVSSTTDGTTIRVIGIHPWCVFQNLESRAYAATNTASAIVKDVCKNSPDFAYIKPFVESKNFGISEGSPNTLYLRDYEDDLHFIEKILKDTKIEGSPSSFFIDLRGVPHLSSQTALAAGKPKGGISGGSNEKNPSKTLIMSKVSQEIANKDFTKVDDAYYVALDTCKVNVGNNWNKTLINVLSENTNVPGAAVETLLAPAIKDGTSHKDSLAYPFDRTAFNTMTATQSIVQTNVQAPEVIYKGASKLRGSEQLVQVSGHWDRSRNGFGVFPDVGETVVYSNASATSALNGIYIVSDLELKFEYHKNYPHQLNGCVIYEAEISGDITLARPHLDLAFQSKFRQEFNAPTAFNKNTYEKVKV